MEPTLENSIHSQLGTPLKAERKIIQKTQQSLKRTHWVRRKLLTHRKLFLINLAFRFEQTWLAVYIKCVQ